MAPWISALIFSLFLLPKPTISSPKSIALPLLTMKTPLLSPPAKPPAKPPAEKPPSKLLFNYGVGLVVPLSVGFPPQNVTMVIDTGSELSWLNCKESPNQPTFYPLKSSSYSPVICGSETCRTKTRDFPVPTTCDQKKLCHFDWAYADASTSEGNLAFEKVSLGDSTQSSIVFGCVFSSFSSPPNAPKTTGMMGLNRGALSFVSQMGFPKFSYCISDATSSGLLLFGETTFTMTMPLNYTPLVQIPFPLPYFDRVAYSIQLEGIRVSGKLLQLPKEVFLPDHTGAGQTMVDSGTQFTFLLGPVYTALKNEFLKQTQGVLSVIKDENFVYQGALDLCYTHPPLKPLPVLPEVVLVFRGAEMVVSGNVLLYKTGLERERNDVYCLSFGNSDLVPVEAYIIGHHHQRNQWVEYDLEKARLGFAPARCDLARQMVR
ncbi:hypothetical protein AMTRI_Chr08g161980 [Amborella trichopoda]